MPVATQGATVTTQLVGYTTVNTHLSNASLSAAVTLTPPTGATKILIQCTGQNVRYRLDGGIPTASVGFQLTTGGDPRAISLPTGSVLMVIEETATATIQYQWGS